MLAVTTFFFLSNSFANERLRNPIGTWYLEGGWKVSADNSCSYETNDLGWPGEPSCIGYIFYTTDDRALMKEERILKELREFQSPPKLPPLSVEGLTGTPKQLYELLLKQNKPIIGINNAFYELTDFTQKAEAVQQKNRNELLTKANDKRNDLMVRWAVKAMILAAAAGLLYLLWSKAPDAIRSLRNAGDRASNKLQEAQVRRIARDEVIRQATREAMTEASDAEKQALRNQIKQALDNGNKELADTLSSVLNKLENSQSA